MAKTNAWSTSLPPDTGESPKLGAQRIRELSLAIKEAFAVDHKTGTTPDSDAETGEHLQVTLRARTNPSAVALKGTIFLKDVGSGVCEFFTIDAAGNIKQLTTGGKLNILDADGVVVKTGTQTIAGEKTFSDITSLAKASILASTDAPTTDAMIAPKKYVDDTVAAKTGLGAWTTTEHVINTEYTATVDGDVCAYAYGTNAYSDGEMTGETPTGTTRTASNVRDSTAKFGVSFPVKSGNTWKVVCSIGGGGEIADSKVYFIPTGT